MVPADEEPARPTSQPAPAVQTENPLPDRPSTPERPSAPLEEVGSLKIFLIALEDGGVSGPPVGCGDSLVPVEFEITTTSAPLRPALEKLLSLHNQFYGQSGLYNALYRSDLRVDSVRVENGEAIVELSGSLLSGGVCDDPRIIAQLRATALQFSVVRDVRFTVNGRSLEEILSGK